MVVLELLEVRPTTVRIVMSNTPAKKVATKKAAAKKATTTKDKNVNASDGATNSDSVNSDSGSSPVPTETTLEAPVPGTISDSELGAPPANAGFVSKERETYADVQADSKETLGYLGEPEEKDLAFTIVAHMDPARQADPNGIYLDDIQRRNAELVRARIEDREPDLENPPFIASDVVMPTVAAQGQALPGTLAPVSSVEKVSVGVTEDELAYNSAAAENQGRNLDGTRRNDSE